jgi:hypothetical protein
VFGEAKAEPHDPPCEDTLQEAYATYKVVFDWLHCDGYCTKATMLLADGLGTVEKSVLCRLAGLNRLACKIVTVGGRIRELDSLEQNCCAEVVAAGKRNKTVHAPVVDAAAAGGTSTAAVSSMHTGKRKTVGQSSAAQETAAERKARKKAERKATVRHKHDGSLRLTAALRSAPCSLCRCVCMCCDVLRRARAMNDSVVSGSALL